MVKDYLMSIAVLLVIFVKDSSYELTNLPGKQILIWRTIEMICKRHSSGNMP